MGLAGLRPYIDMLIARGEYVTATVHRLISWRQTSNLFVVCDTTATIPNGVAGYAVGCILLDMQAGLIYTNTGSVTSCSFTSSPANAPANITVASTKFIVGNGSGVGAAVNMSGSASLANTGAVTVLKDSDANLIADPGGANQAIPVTASGYVPIVTAGAETNTLTYPTFIGQRLLLICNTHSVGNRVITVASAINATGNNTITLSAAGQAIELIGIKTGASTYAWKVASNMDAGLSTG